MVDRSWINPTQKPVALMEYLIKTYTNENETVLDFTAGSFTTGVACVNTNRKFIGIEMDKGYFDIGVGRIKERIKCLDLKIEPEINMAERSCPTQEKIIGINTYGILHVRLWK